MMRGIGGDWFDRLEGIYCIIVMVVGQSIEYQGVCIIVTGYPYSNLEIKCATGITIQIAFSCQFIPIRVQ